MDPIDPREINVKETDPDRRGDEGSNHVLKPFYLVILSDRMALQKN